MANVVVFYLSLIVTCGIALWKGGGPERVVAVCWLAAVAATAALTPLKARAYFADVEIGILVVDSLLFLALGGVAIMANRYWPIWVSSIQLVAVAAHAAKAYEAEIPRFMYHAAAAYTAYPMLALMAAGAIRHRRRLRRNGTDPDWRTYSRPSPTNRSASPGT